MAEIRIDHNKENKMTEAEALMVIKPKTQREICLWITDTSLTLIAKDGFKRVQGDTFGQEKFFLQDIIRWKKA